MNSIKSQIYRETEGSAAELADVLDYQGAGLDYAQASRLVSQLHGRVLVDKLVLDLFAAQLLSEVNAGTTPRHLYDQFVAIFGGEAGAIVETF